MGHVAQFRRGTKTLNIASGIYALGNDFKPPGTNITPSLSAGTSANRTRGPIKVGERADPVVLSFSVRIFGASNAEVEMGRRRIASFLSGAGDETDPTYFEWRPDNNVGFEPSWGSWGINLRLEVVHADVMPDVYSMADTVRNKAQMAYIVLTCKPFAMGKRMIVGHAKGYILEDTLGTVDGRSRGLIVSEASSNKFTNPIFGYSTWDNGWSVGGATLLIEQITDPEYILFGSSAVKLSRTGGDSAFYQSINVGNTNSHTMSCFVRLADKTAVTASHVKIYYNGSDQTATYTAIGNGWYRVHATFTGVASAVVTGIRVAATGVTIYCDGFMLDEDGHLAPFGYGDCLGWAWSGTAHNSTSSCTAAYWRLPINKLFNNAQGTIRLAWRPSRPSTLYSGNAVLFTINASSSIYLRWNASISQWQFSDGTNTISTGSSTSFSAETEYIFHITWGPGSLKIYLNGAQNATGSTYTQQAAGTYLYLGTDTTPAGHSNGTYSDLAISWRAMTATEVLNDYTNIYEHVTGGDGYGQRLGAIPWAYTYDGDMVLDNCLDSTRKNFAFIGGVPGDMPAETEIDFDYTTAAAPGAIWFSNAPHDVEAVPKIADGSGVVGDYYNEDFDGTGSTSADSGSAYTSQGIGSDTTIYLEPESYKNIYKGPTHWFMRMSCAAGNTLGLRPRFLYASSAAYINGDVVTFVGDATRRIYYLGQLDTESNFEKLVWPGESFPLGWAVNGYSSPTGNIELDFIMLMVGDLLKITTASGGSLADDGAVRVKGLEGFYATSAGGIYGRAGLVGKPIEFHPDKLNFFRVLIGAHAAAHTVSDTGTLTVYVTPRWSIL